MIGRRLKEPYLEPVIEWAVQIGRDIAKSHEEHQIQRPPRHRTEPGHTTSASADPKPAGHWCPSPDVCRCERTTPEET